MIIKQININIIALSKKIFTLISTIYNRLYWWTKIFIYKRKGNDHIFNVKIDDFEYKLSFGDQPITANIVQRIEGRREPETLAIYKSIITPGMKVLELGACFGEFTVILDHLVGNKGKLLSVEGTPNIFKILENNFKLNNLENTSIHKLFISNDAEEVIFMKDDKHPYDAIDRLKGKNYSELSNDLVKQKSMKISKFLNIQKFQPDIILMDIEGFEVDVLEDLLLNEDLSYRPKIMFEIHEQLYEADKNIDYLQNLLRNNNYHSVRISSNLFCYQK